MDKAIGRLAKTTATVSGDKSLEAGGWTTQRMGERKTYVVTTHADGGWKVQAEGASERRVWRRTTPKIGVRVNCVQAGN